MFIIIPDDDDMGLKMKYQLVYRCGELNQNTSVVNFWQSDPRNPWLIFENIFTLLGLNIVDILASAVDFGYDQAHVVEANNSQNPSTVAF